TSSASARHPFSTLTTEETLQQTFGPLSQWEDKFRQLILLGKQLPTLSADLKPQAKEVAGCATRVWLGCGASGVKLNFCADSEGRIVRGLLAGLLTAIEGKSAAELLAHSPLALFDELGLRT
ncbi:cysteine desulfurase sulfur acceptor subunit CsdE, partial [Enterobacter cloacae complex sp. 4DZ3-17B2]|uniref:cysteine desulfurase sulfur acceptor subunit CsdE n=1 Tax=Enterobacter cloacae complex sp. 4DZ3-17B2 TaxID=2511990 RepID=UPI0010106D1C